MTPVYSKAAVSFKPAAEVTRLRSEGSSRISTPGPMGCVQRYIGKIWNRKTNCEHL